MLNMWMCRCVLFLVLRLKALGGIQRGGDIASFMVLASECDLEVLVSLFAFLVFMDFSFLNVECNLSRPLLSLYQIL